MLDRFIKPWYVTSDQLELLAASSGLPASLLARSGVTPGRAAFWRQAKRKKFRNIKGKRYGRLVVIGRSTYLGPRSGKPIEGWKCQCDCGKIFHTRAWTLFSGAALSCGCWNHDKAKKGLGESTFNSWFLTTRHEATKRRKLEWTLTKETARKLITANCHYCGIPPHRTLYKKKCSNGTLVANGIDRKDNNKGYTAENCVPCCWLCNAAKRNLSFNEWESWLNRIAKFKNKKHNQCKGNQ